ncbi:MAG TPA: hypothetical protein VK474_09595 [Chthoniobacterales bacterium]|nr:hypothetical protein [Chthoniobacterales bacterium]
MNIASKKVTFAVPELALLAMTRGIFGLGLGLLLAGVLEKRTARGVGVALVMVGVVTTVPLGLRIREKLE